MASPLLPNEPRIPDEQREQALTVRFLSPALAELESLFLALRGELDPALRQARPVKQGKPFPLGQCLEISQAVQRQLQQLDPATLDGDAAQGYRALAAFMQHGGSVRQVWGDLRGEYFQNAFLVGTLYVDVANDTVDPAKPSVEVLPFAASRLVPVADYRHFARVAARYWQARVYPNHLLPELAPFFPLITVTAAGFVQLQAASNYMIALTLAGAFRPAETVLAEAPMNASLFGLLRQRLASQPCALPVALAAYPEAGRAAALAMCQTYREQEIMEDTQRRDTAVKAVLRVNGELARFRVEASEGARPQGVLARNDG